MNTENDKRREVIEMEQIERGGVRERRGLVGRGGRGR